MLKKSISLSLKKEKLSIFSSCAGENKPLSVFGVSSQRFLLVDEIPECRKRKYIIHMVLIFCKQRISKYMCYVTFLSTDETHTITLRLQPLFQPEKKYSHYLINTRPCCYDQQPAFEVYSLYFLHIFPH